MTRGEWGDRSNIIWVASEDSAGIDIRPRLDAAGARVERAFRVTRPIRLPDDAGVLAHTVEQEVGDVGLLVIDPLSSHFRSRVNQTPTQTCVSVSNR